MRCMKPNDGFVNRKLEKWPSILSSDIDSLFRLMRYNHFRMKHSPTLCSYSHPYIGLFLSRKRGNSAFSVLSSFSDFIKGLCRLALRLFISKCARQSLRSFPECSLACPYYMLLISEQRKCERAQKMCKVQMVS